MINRNERLTNEVLVDALGGSDAAWADLVRAVEPDVRSLGRRMPPYLDGLGLDEDVFQETLVILCQKGPESFDPTRGDALSYVMAIAGNARRKVVADHAPPGARTRPHRDEDGEWVRYERPASLHQLVEDGERGGSLNRALIASAPSVENAALGNIEAARLLQTTRTEGGEDAAKLVVFLAGGLGLAEAAEVVGISRFAARRTIDRTSNALVFAA